MSEVEFSKLCKCNPEKGYALDYDYVELNERKVVEKATKNVYEEIKECIGEIERGTGKRIGKFEIRKTYIRNKIIRRRAAQFELSDSSTWKNELSRYYDKEWDGAVVVAAMNDYVLQRHCKKRGCIMNAEEYALLLKTRVTQKFIREGNKEISDTSKPGSKDGGKSNGYILYIAYILSTDVKFHELCQPTPERSYAFRYVALRKEITIAKATKLVYRKIKKRIEVIEMGTTKGIKKFCIRKTSISSRKEGFQLGNTSTWTHSLEALFKKDSPDGLVVVAAMDDRAIPSSCESRGCIIDAEEYALLLKTRIIQMFKDEGDKRIKDASGPGNKDGGESRGYILYITYYIH